MTFTIENILGLIDDDTELDKPAEYFDLYEVRNLADPQKLPFYRLVDFLANKDGSYIFCGGAGTGKTYVLCQLYKWYIRYFTDNHGYSPATVVLAPSHKAKRNASAMGKENGVSFEARTISSFLGLSPVLNEASGKEEFKKSDRAEKDFIESDEYDLIIVDEAFMVSREHIELILDTANNAKVLWVGDPKQLPPIGENKSYLLDLDIPIVELKKVIRYSGDLARIAESWREEISRKRFPIVQTQDNSITELSRLEWIEQFSETLKASLDEGDLNGAPRLLAWTNSATLKWANWTRDLIYGDSTIPFYKGEILICRKPLFRRNASSKKKDKFDIVADNGTELEVIDDFKIIDVTIDTEEYKCYPVTPTFSTPIRKKIAVSVILLMIGIVLSNLCWCQ
jgi:exodeoxyribonuclease-5